MAIPHTPTFPPHLARLLPLALLPALSLSCFLLRDGDDGIIPAPPNTQGPVTCKALPLASGDTYCSNNHWTCAWSLKDWDCGGRWECSGGGTSASNRLYSYRCRDGCCRCESGGRTGTINHDYSFQATCAEASKRARASAACGFPPELTGDLNYNPKSGSLRLLVGRKGVAGSHDGPDRAATLNSPQAVAVQGGQVFFADSGSHTIRSLQCGEVQIFAGGGAGFQDGAADQARFNGIHGLAAGSDGSLYVADTANHRVRVINKNGVVSTLAGSGDVGFADGPAATARFNNPQGVAVDSSGRVFVADTANHRVRIINKNGVVSTLAGVGKEGTADGPVSTAQLLLPAQLAVSPSGDRVYLSDTLNGRLRLIQGGQVSTPSQGLLTKPMGLLLDGKGDLWVVDTHADALFQLKAGAMSRVTSALNRPTALALDSKGRVLVADTGNHVIQVYHP